MAKYCSFKLLKLKMLDFLKDVKFEMRIPAVGAITLVAELRFEYLDCRNCCLSGDAGFYSQWENGYFELLKLKKY